LWKATVPDDESTECPTDVAQTRRGSIGSNPELLKSSDSEERPDVHQTRATKPRHGPPKMPVVKRPASADLERDIPLEWVDDEDLTTGQLKAEVRRRDRAKKAWLPRPAVVNQEGVDPDQHEVLDG